MIQNNKCYCANYLVLNYIKSNSLINNKLKTCKCFNQYIIDRLNELNLKNYYINKDELIRKLLLKSEYSDIRKYNI